MANDEKFAKTIDDDELDQVAGGTKQEIKKDIKFLNAMGVELAENATGRQIFDAWKSVGIVCVQNSSEKNEYFSRDERIPEAVVRGKSISRQDAIILAMRQTKKVVDLDDYD